MSDDSWNRIPDAKVRIPETGLQSLLDGLAVGGFAVGYKNKIELLDDGIYIELSTNVGTYPNIVPFPVEIFIPVPPDKMPKVKPDDSEVESKPEDTKPDVRAIAELPSGPEDIALVPNGDASGASEYSHLHGRASGSTDSNDSNQPKLGQDARVCDGMPDGLQSGIGNDVLVSPTISTS